MLVNELRYRGHREKDCIESSERITIDSEMKYLYLQKLRSYCGSTVNAMLEQCVLGSGRACASGQELMCSFEARRGRIARSALAASNTFA